jgi:tRNA (adenine57-N1/adenine58-N1)-methyltransferase
MRIKKLAVTPTKYVYPIEDLNRSIHMNEGCVDRQDLVDKNHNGIISTMDGKEILFCPATFKDNMNKMQRKAAIIIPKDVGFIIAETGLTKNSVVLDVGGGSGAATCQLAALCKKVYSFDINPAHVKVIKENCEAMELHNVEVVEKDVIDIKLSEQVDLAVIDLPEPLKAFKILKQVVKQSGFIVFYTPHISQAQDVVNALDDDYKYITTIELIQRRWEVGEKMLRPKHDMLGHTAFLTVVRKFAKN